MEVKFYLIAYGFLFVALITSFISLWKQFKYSLQLPVGAMLLALLALSLGLIQRSMTAGRLPFASLYEFTLLFVWGLLLLFMFVQRKIKSPLFNALVALLGVILLSCASTLPSETAPLMPALQSIWLQFHVFTAIVAYGAFGLSFCAGVVYLLKGRLKEKALGLALPSSEKLEEVLHWSVVVGFSFMTLVLITGAVWAEEVWGSWWSWDPKETWALITWLIYAGYLHARKSYGWTGEKAALMAVIGFAAVLFTLFGVSLLIPGYHSYL
ncbi:MAG: c-type cytochrome biogenesis protein CcsB [Thermanaeromonas sp.]|uniref:c-type cytochrome biogenesis protein CcsB n=1 Tax=Thermanaeromonas sp. TaxID=2003697 RepID=UPI00243A4DD0|nr:c-type cytochrome biogenesis protein CcsB [Thermanaeromonas sp.]MCG0279081.1 c-type cytochrome biogenesis protein CcsB [Thermanaeromonas sp.]